jgi:hypothetical protein
MRLLAVAAILITMLVGCQSAMDSRLVLPECVHDCSVVVIYSDTEALFERGGQSPSTSIQVPLVP